MKENLDFTEVAAVEVEEEEEEEEEMDGDEDGDLELWGFKMRWRCGDVGQVEARNCCIYVVSSPW